MSPVSMMKIHNLKTKRRIKLNNKRTNQSFKQFSGAAFLLFFVHGTGIGSFKCCLGKTCKEENKIYDVVETYGETRDLLPAK